MSTRKILFWGALALLAAVPIACQKSSGVTVKQDGDAVVLIPQDPGKAYLVLGVTRDGNPEGSPGQLTSLAGEQRIPAKEFSKLVIYEVRPVSEVMLSAGQQFENPCKGGTCDDLYPLGCPPRCAPRSMYLLPPLREPKGGL